MVKTLVGFKRFTSKKGNSLCVAIVSSPFTPADNDRGSYGCDMESVFLPAEQYEYLKPSDIGLPVETVYNIFNGRAYLQEIKVARK